MYKVETDVEVDVEYRHLYLDYVVISLLDNKQHNIEFLVCLKIQM